MMNGASMEPTDPQDTQGQTEQQTQFTQAPQQQQAQPYVGTPVSQPTQSLNDQNKNTLAVIALILSIVGLIIPLLPIVALVLAILAIIKARRMGGKSQGMALAALIITIFVLVLHGTILYFVKNTAEKIDRDLSVKTPSSRSLSETAKQPSEAGQYSSNTVPSADTQAIIKITSSYLSKLSDNNYKESYNLLSSYYKSTTGSTLYKGATYPLLQSQSYDLAKPVWISKRSIGSNTTYGIVYSLDGSQDFTGSRYIILSVDSSKSKVHAIRLSTAKTGKEIKSEEEAFTKATHTLVYPARSTSGRSMYSAGEISSK